jgi:hypothetical protein
MREQLVTDGIGNHYGPMPPPGTAYGNSEITFAFDDVVWDQEEEQIQDTF